MEGGDKADEKGQAEAEAKEKDEEARNPLRPLPGSVSVFFS